MSKKPKPATVGLKIAGDVYPEGTIDHTICRQLLARCIDAALRRERMKERRRCSRIVVAGIGGEIDDAKMLEMVRNGEAL